MELKSKHNNLQPTNQVARRLAPIVKETAPRGLAAALKNCPQRVESACASVYYVHVSDGQARTGF